LVLHVTGVGVLHSVVVSVLGIRLKKKQELFRKRPTSIQSTISDKKDDFLWPSCYNSHKLAMLTT
jgi:hypothetical protein